MSHGHTYSLPLEKLLGARDNYFSRLNKRDTSRIMHKRTNHPAGSLSPSLFPNTDFSRDHSQSFNHYTLNTPRILQDAKEPSQKYNPLPGLSQLTPRRPHPPLDIIYPPILSSNRERNRQYPISTDSQDSNGGNGRLRSGYFTQRYRGERKDREGYLESSSRGHNGTDYRHSDDYLGYQGYSQRNHHANVSPSGHSRGVIDYLLKTSNQRYNPSASSIQSMQRHINLNRMEILKLTQQVTHKPTLSLPTHTPLKKSTNTSKSPSPTDNKSNNLSEIKRRLKREIKRVERDAQACHESTKSKSDILLMQEKMIAFLSRENNHIEEYLTAQNTILNKIDKQYLKEISQRDKMKDKLSNTSQYRFDYSNINMKSIFMPMKSNFNIMRQIGNMNNVKDERATQNVNNDYQLLLPLNIENPASGSEGKITTNAQNVGMVRPRIERGSLQQVVLEPYSPFKRSLESSTMNPLTNFLSSETKDLRPNPNGEDKKSHNYFSTLSAIQETPPTVNIKRDLLTRAQSEIRSELDNLLEIKPNSSSHPQKRLSGTENVKAFGRTNSKSAKTRNREIGLASDPLTMPSNSVPRRSDSQHNSNHHHVWNQSEQSPKLFSKGGEGEQRSKQTLDPSVIPKVAQESSYSSISEISIHGKVMMKEGGQDVKSRILDEDQNKQDKFNENPSVDSSHKNSKESKKRLSEGIQKLSIASEALQKPEDTFKEFPIKRPAALSKPYLPLETIAEPTLSYMPEDTIINNPQVGNSIYNEALKQPAESKNSEAEIRRQSTLKRATSAEIQAKMLAEVNPVNARVTGVEDTKIKTTPLPDDLDRKASLKPDKATFFSVSEKRFQGQQSLNRRRDDVTSLVHRNTFDSGLDFQRSGGHPTFK